MKKILSILTTFTLVLTITTQLIACSSEDYGKILPEFFLDSRTLVFMQTDLQNKNIEIKDIIDVTDKFIDFVKTELLLKTLKPEKNLDMFIVTNSVDKEKADSSQTKEKLLEFKIENPKLKNQKTGYTFLTFDTKLTMFKKEKNSDKKYVWKTTNCDKTVGIKFYILDNTK